MHYYPMNDSNIFLKAGLVFADDALSVCKRYTGGDFLVTEKVDKSLVTEADIEIERVLRLKIEEMFPDHGVIGEEFSATHPESPYQWILDPIDGTEEFVNGLPLFGCIISLEYKHSPIVGIIDLPMVGIRIYASKGGGTFCNGKRVVLSDLFIPSEKLRLGISKRANFSRYVDEDSLFNSITQNYRNLRIFDSCFAYAATASGGLDAMVDYNVRHWDISACRILCEEAGGDFRWVKKTVTPKGFIAYSAVFGKKKAVAEISDTFFQGGLERAINPIASVK
jgi:fructose-1,6-bisphosphatase/inositol monophosphatase family enzyme